MEWPKWSCPWRSIRASTERKVRSAACQVSATGHSQAKSRWAWPNTCQLPPRDPAPGPASSRRACSRATVGARSWWGSAGSSGSSSRRLSTRAPSSCKGLRRRSSTGQGPSRHQSSGRAQRQLLSNRSPWCTRVSRTQSSAASAHQRSASRARATRGPRRRQGSGQARDSRRWHHWPPRGQTISPRAAQSGRWREAQGWSRAESSLPAGVARSQRD